MIGGGERRGREEVRLGGAPVASVGGRRFGSARPPAGRTPPRWLSGGFLIPRAVFFLGALCGALAEPTGHHIASASPFDGRPDPPENIRGTHAFIVMVVTKDGDRVSLGGGEFLVGAGAGEGGGIWRSGRRGLSGGRVQTGGGEQQAKAGNEFHSEGSE